MCQHISLYIFQDGQETRLEERNEIAERDWMKWFTR